MQPEKTRSSAYHASVVILGAGPTGIGAAWRMAQLCSNGLDSLQSQSDTLPFLLLDQSLTPGGRAGSHTTPEGFTFDIGGHVLFPHAEYSAFIDLLDSVVLEWHSSIPIRGVWVAGRIIPTPVQRNIHRMPIPTLAACLWGLLRRKSNSAEEIEPTLLEYLEQQFGSALTKEVMGPLNQKMWAHSPTLLGSFWSSHRSGSKEKNIPDVSVLPILCNLVLNRDQPGWNDTTRVRYPLRGGMGLIWDKIFHTLPKSYTCLGCHVQRIDTRERKIYIENGPTVGYTHLITSIPMDGLLRLLSDRPDLTAMSYDFHRAGVQIFGFGLKGKIPSALKGVHAISVPAPEIPFWRINFPSNFSPGNAPPVDGVWSVLCEISVHPEANVQFDLAQVEDALRQMGIIPRGTEVISRYSESFAHGYPVPFAGRDNLLNSIHQELEQVQIYSRGRFGGWRYEVSNQDHSFMQGVEVVDRIFEKKPEYTYQKTW